LSLNVYALAANCCSSLNEISATEIAVNRLVVVVVVGAV